MFSYDPSAKTQRSSLSDLDSLIYDELQTFNLPADQITERRLEVDSLFYRKTFEIGAPPGLSKTFLHAELAGRVAEAGWETRGRVEFPDRDIRMEIASDNTLVRTIRIRQDSTARRTLNPASLLVSFDATPQQTQLNLLESYGEPIGILLRGSSPQQLKAQFENVDDYPYLTGFWPVEQADDEIDNPFAFASELRSVQSTPVLFSLSSGVETLQPQETTPINWIIAEQAVIAGSEHGREAFNRDLREFSNRAARGERPILVISADDQTLQWLDDAIYDLKKGGLVLTNPLMQNDDP